VRTEHDAEIVVQLREIWLERDGARQESGSVVPIELVRDHAEPVEAAEMLRVGRAHLPVKALGFDQPAGAMVRARLRKLLVGALPAL
jgi:hypothetical protein